MPIKDSKCLNTKKPENNRSRKRWKRRRGGIGDYQISLNGTTLTTREINTLSWEGHGVPGDDSIYTYTVRGKKSK